MTKSTGWFSGSLTLLLLVAMVLASCGPTAAPPPEATAQPTKAAAVQATNTSAPPAATTSPGGPRRGGTLTWVRKDILERGDPVWTEAAVDSEILSHIVEGLTRPNPVTAEIEPCLAEDWDLSEDGTVFTFHLRPNVKFHNGKALTADDVIASLERARTTGVHQWTLENVTEMKAVDGATVEITLNEALAAFPARLAMISNTIFPKEEIDKVGDGEIEMAIGTGPFMLTEWVRADHVTMGRNPDYWEMGEDGQPLPYLDAVIDRQISEDATRVLQVQAGTAQGTEEIPYSMIASLVTDPRGVLKEYSVQQLYFLVINLVKPPFDDLKFRQALDLALDRQVFVDRATAGRTTPANSFLTDLDLCWNPDAKLPYDLEKAKQLVKESKYPDGYSGVKMEINPPTCWAVTMPCSPRRCGARLDLRSRSRRPRRRCWVKAGTRTRLKPSPHTSGPIRSQIQICIFDSSSLTPACTRAISPAKRQSTWPSPSQRRRSRKNAVR